MKRFDLFGYLGQKDNEEATTYQCGYYVINKYTNKIETNKINDLFYTFIGNTLAKFIMTEYGDIQYFTVYELKTFKDSDWWKINSLIMYKEDVNEDVIPQLLDLDNYDPLDISKIDKELLEKLEKYSEE